MPNLCEHAIDAIAAGDLDKLDNILNKMRQWPAFALRQKEVTEAFEKDWEKSYSKPDPADLTMTVNGQDSRRSIEYVNNSYYLNTPLMAAARRNKKDNVAADAIAKLAKEKAIDNVFDESGKNALLWAVVTGNLNAVKQLLIEFGFNSKPLLIRGIPYVEATRSSKSPLLEAATQANVGIIKLLMLGGAVPTVAVFEGLIKSNKTEKEKLQALKEICEAKGPENTPQKNVVQKQLKPQEQESEMGAISGACSLALQLESESEESVADTKDVSSALLKSSQTQSLSRVEKKGDAQQTLSLDTTAETKQQSITTQVGELKAVSEGVTVKRVSQDVFTAALKVAVLAEPPSAAIVEYLCKQYQHCYGYINQYVDDKYRTLVFLAAQKNNRVEILQVLAKFKLDFTKHPEHQSHEDDYVSPLMAAVKSKVDPQQLKVLVQSGSNINHQNGKALTIAIQNESYELVESLISSTEASAVEDLKLTQDNLIRALLDVIDKYKTDKKLVLLKIFEYLLPKLKNLTHQIYSYDLSVHATRAGVKEITNIIERETLRRKSLSSITDTLKERYLDTVKQDAKSYMETGNPLLESKLETVYQKTTGSGGVVHLKTIVDEQNQDVDAFETKLWEKIKAFTNRQTHNVLSKAVMGIKTAEQLGLFLEGIKNSNEAKDNVEGAKDIFNYITEVLTLTLKDKINKVKPETFAIALNFCICIEANISENLRVGDCPAPFFKNIWEIIKQHNAFDVVKTKINMHGKAVIPLDCALGGSNLTVGNYITEQLLEFAPGTQKRLTIHEDKLNKDTRHDVFDLVFLLEDKEYMKDMLTVELSDTLAKKIAQRIDGAIWVLKKLSGIKVANLEGIDVFHIIDVVARETTAGLQKSYVPIITEISKAAQKNLFAKCLNGLKVAQVAKKDTDQKQGNGETKSEIANQNLVVSNLEQQWKRLEVYFNNYPHKQICRVLYCWRAGTPSVLKPVPVSKSADTTTSSAQPPVHSSPVSGIVVINDRRGSYVHVANGNGAGRTTSTSNAASNATAPTVGAANGAAPQPRW